MKPKIALIGGGSIGRLVHLLEDKFGDVFIPNKLETDISAFDEFLPYHNFLEPTPWTKSEARVSFDLVPKFTLPEKEPKVKTKEELEVRKQRKAKVKSRRNKRGY